MNLSAVRIFVRDLAGARHFYADMLGLPLAVDGLEHGWCVFKAGAVDLVVEAVGGDAPDEDQALVGRFTGLSFAVPDVAERHRALMACGIRFSGAPERQPWGGILATLLDPAGNALQIVQHPAPSSARG